MNRKQDWENLSGKNTQEVKRGHVTLHVDEQDMQNKGDANSWYFWEANPNSRIRTQEYYTTL